jgi:hypothetical protein
MRASRCATAHRDARRAMPRARRRARRAIAATALALAARATRGAAIDDDAATRAVRCVALTRHRRRDATTRRRDDATTDDERDGARSPTPANASSRRERRCGSDSGRATSSTWT